MKKQKRMALWMLSAMLLASTTACGDTAKETAELDLSAVTTEERAAETEEAVQTTKSSATTVHTTKSTAVSTTKTTAVTSTTSAAKQKAAVGQNGNTASGQGNTGNAAGGNDTAQENAGTENQSAGQNQNQSQNQNANQNSSGGNAANSGQDQSPAPVITEPDASETPEEIDDTIYITLNGDRASVSDNNGVSVSGGVVTILQAGRYEVTGNLNDGQIVVNVSKEEKVNLHLNGAGITCSSSAPLYILSADTCTVHLDDGSTNYLEDTAANTLSACLFSKDDLTIKGGGTLTVIGNKKHGIKSSNDVKIKNGSLTVSAVSTGVYGEDSVQITGGEIVISSCKDGIKASNELEAEKGFILMENGYVDVQNAAGNGMEAISGVTISGGTVNIHSAKKPINCSAQSIAEGCLFSY